ncbi:aspartokinase [Clostridia bacterium]|nr:aspartokinase [Clostridia bacterium]
MFVVKFGGSSLADAAQFRKVKAIIESDDKRRYVIPSAPGKRFADDRKVTDMLYKFCWNVAKGMSAETEFEPIKARFDEIISELSLSVDLNDEYDKIKSEVTSGGNDPAANDYAASRGEYLNGKILAAYLGFDFIDAADVIKFSKDGFFLSEKTEVLLSQTLEKHKKAVIPGFYGQIIESPVIKTFSRGGSDFTGSIVARAVKAEMYENWTDVSGFMMADPRIVKDPPVIDVLTYRELRELSYMGATVLHEDAIFPVRKAHIPINIKNTNDPAAPGTFIYRRTAADSKYTITGISGKKNFRVINIEKGRMNDEIGYIYNVLSFFKERKINIEHIPSGVDTMSVIFDAKYLSNSDINENEFINELKNKRYANTRSVKIPEEKLALITIVGRGIKGKPGMIARVCTALANFGINIKSIEQGSSEISIIIAVNENDCEKAIKAIYNSFVV